MQVEQDKAQRAFELLKRIRSNDYHITSVMRKEIIEVCMEDWERRVRAEYDCDGVDLNR